MQQETACLWHLWQEALHQAIDETDPRLALEKVQAAELALFLRIGDFSPSPDRLEERALFDALDTIRILRTFVRR